MTPDDSKATLAPYREAIETGLRDALTCPHPALAAYYDMMHYHLGWVDATGQPARASSGKRLRPILCLLACQSAGGDWTQALPVAVAVELLHNFSLVHDDIQDRDAERRHRPTVWKVWGVPHAINVGDGMFGLAHQAFLRLVADGDVPTDTLVTVFQRFEETCVALCHGQFLDMSFETWLDVTLDDYLDMVWGKTASLFAAALEMGALLGMDGPAVAACYRTFGMELGQAFQVQDDVLGIWGDPATTGKPAANDLRQRKKTWPMIYALEHATGPARQDLRAFCQEARPDEADVMRVLGILDDLGARVRAETLVAEYHGRALAALDRAAGREPAAGWLRTLAQTLVGRER